MGRIITSKKQQRRNEFKSIYKHYPSSNQVILFIHGIIEGPKQFRHLAQIAYKMGYSISIVLLPGHGKSGKYFAGTSSEEWIIYISEQMNKLRKQYEEILIVGHSMGALMTICEMAANDKKIAGAILIDPPIKVHLWPRVIKSSITIGIKSIKLCEPYTRAEYHAISVYPIRVCDYLRGILRYFELFILIQYTKKQIHKMNKPILLIFAGKDEFVNLKSRNFFMKIPCRVEEIILEDSGHFCYHHTDLIRLEEAFEAFIRRFK